MVKPRQSAPTVYTYKDYRAYLRDCVQAARENNHRLTMGSLARILHLKDTSSINKVLRGQRHPGGVMVTALAKWLRLSGREEAYFRDLIALAKVPYESDEHLRLLERIEAQQPRRQFRCLEEREFSVLSQPIYLLVRELVNLPDFQEDMTWIKKRLAIPTTEAQLQDVIEVLLSTGLLCRDDTGRLRQSPSAPHYQSPHEVRSDAVRRYHERALEHSKGCIRQVSMEQRHLLSSTFGVKRQHLRAFKEKLDELCDQFVATAESSTPDEVYQLNIQFVPLTTQPKVVEATDEGGDLCAVP